jgi:hypothetical protein
MLQDKQKVLWANDVHSIMDLIFAMRHKMTVTVTHARGQVAGKVNSIEAESGSGYDWNITVNGQTVYWDERRMPAVIWS